MEPHEHVAKAFDKIMGAGLPPALRHDDTLEYEDGPVKLLADFRIDDYGNDFNAPKCTVVNVVADFGGRTQAQLKLTDISGDLLNELETLAADKVTVEEWERRHGGER
jgi:hypothetical protein